MIGLGQATMDGPQDSGRQEDNRTAGQVMRYTLKKKMTCIKNINLAGAG